MHADLGDLGQCDDRIKKSSFRANPIAIGCNEVEKSILQISPFRYATVEMTTYRFLN